MFSHFLRESTQPDTRHVIDRKPRILGVFQREHTRATPPNLRVLESLCDPLQAHTLRHLIQHDLDEDTTTRSCFVFREFNTLHHRPRNRVSGEEMTEKPSYIPKSVGLVSMNGGVVKPEGALETIVPDSVELAESFADETIKGGVRSLLRAALYDHFAELYLFAFFELNLEKFMNGFFVVQGIHDREVDDTTQVREICRRAVLNAFLFLDNFFFVFLLRLGLLRPLFIRAIFTQDFSFDGLVPFLVLDVVRIEFEDVETLLDLQFLLKLDLMSDLIVFLDQI